MALSGVTVSQVTPKVSSVQNAKTQDETASTKIVPIEDIKNQRPDNYKSLIDQAKNSDTPNGATYKLAVDIAKNNLGDDNRVDQQMFKDTVDTIYNEMWNGNPKVSASQLRGEPAGANLIEMAKNVINTSNEGIGTVLDGAFDLTVGNILDWVRGIEGTDPFHSDDINSTKNWFSGKELSVVPDIIEDIGLSMLGPVGWGLVGGKNLIQNSTDLYEGVTGKDSVTLEDLSDVQRGAKFGSGLINSALASLPGIGGSTRLASNLVKKATGKAVDGAESVAKAFTNADGKVNRDAVKKAIDGVNDLTKKETKSVARNSEELKKAITETAKEQNNIVDKKGIFETLVDDIKNYAKNDKEMILKNTVDRFHIPTEGSKARRAAAKAEKQAAKEAKEKAKKDKTALDKAGDAVKNAGKWSKDNIAINGINRFIAPMTLTGANLGLNEMAATGNEDFIDAVISGANRRMMPGDGAFDGSIPMYLLAPLLIGTGKTSRLNRNIRTGMPQGLNKHGRQTIGDNLGYIGQRAGSLGQLDQDLAYSDYLNSNNMSDQDLENSLKALRPRS